MIRRLAAALVAGAVCLGGTAAPADTAVSASVWSTPRAVGGCALPQGPARVAFPQGSPTQRAGAGALVFGAGAGSCPGLAGHASVLELAPIGTNDQPAPTSVISGSGAALGAPVVAGTTQGDVVVAAGRSSGAPGGRAVLGDAPAGAGLTVRALDALPGPLAGATAWLGDAGLVSVQRRNSGAQALVLRVQRHYAAALGAPVVLPVGSAHISSLSLNMDYRSDALVSWAQNGSIYARAVSNSGRIGPTERVGSGGAAPKLSAVYSDDGRAIVAWAVQRMSGGRAMGTRVYLDISGPGLTFGPPRVVDAFANVMGTVLPAGSLRIVRLSTESVVLAWTSVSGGRFVVREAAVSLGGPHPATTVSPAGQDAVLSDLLPGPRGETLALWTAPARAGGGLDTTEQQVMAARAVETREGQMVAGPAEVVSGVGPVADPDGAIDPGSDVAVVTWVDGGGPSAHVMYALRAGVG